jgi:23S rRNA pseudouridine2605 synthase
MSEYSSKDHPRRRAAAHSPAGARDHPKKPPGLTKAKKDFADAATARPPRLCHKATPGNDGEGQTSLAKVARTSVEETGERIAKVMARAGLCSRREAEAWIGEGRVALNGAALTNPAVNVRRDDKVTIDGAPLARRARTRLFMFHKPRGLVTTARDPQGRPTIFDYLREHWPDGPRVVSIGRLDINSEGLLLLTNDGGLARVLELPATGWVRRYRVRAKGETDQTILDRLREGLTLEGVKYAGIEATLDRVAGANSWLTMALREGKNREIKRVLEHIGLQVNRLIRLSFGPFQLGLLAEGAVEEVRTCVLRDQLGPALAKTAGADFLSPLHVENEAEVVDVANARQEKSGPGRDHRNARRGTRSPRPARPRGDDRQPEATAAVKVKPALPARKHVSALRAEYGKPPKERQRIERRETADRGGRTVYVERLVSAKRDDKRQDKRKPPPDSRNGRRFEAGRRDRNDASERKQERWQKPPRAQKTSASGRPNLNTNRAQRRAPPYLKFEAEDRRTGGNPEGRARGRDQAQQRSIGPRSPRPYEKPGGVRPAGGAKPPSGGGPRGRGGPPKWRPRGKS